MFTDLFRYNRWANHKLLMLCEGLRDSEWDHPVPMGFGTLRATLFHLVVADELWQDRFDGRPWAPLPAQDQGVSWADLRERMEAVALRRDRTLQHELDSDYRRWVEYVNTERQAHRNRLGDLLLHLANHSIHHRAQALNMLRRFERTAAGGLDYLFYKLAHPSVPATPETRELAQRWQLEVGAELAPVPSFSAERIRQYCDYGNWATDLLASAAEGLDAAAWSRDFAIGPGSLRKTLSHLTDAERWWMQNQVGATGEFTALPDTISAVDLRAAWRQHATDRAQWLATQTDASLREPVEGEIPGGRLRFRRGEICVQLCGHGTHHRAQVVNMFRQLGRQIVPLDFVAWIRLGSPQPAPVPV